MRENGAQRRQGFDVYRPVESFVWVVRGVFLEPALFFGALRDSYEEVEEEEPGELLLFVGICVAIGFPLRILASPLDPLVLEGADLLSGISLAARDDPDGWIVRVVLLLVLAPIFVILGVYLLAAVQHLFVLLFVGGRRGGFRATFRVVAYTYAIVLVTWIPVLGPALHVYGIYFATVGLREMHTTTTARALLAALVPFGLPLAVTYYNLWTSYAPA